MVVVVCFGLFIMRQRASIFLKVPVHGTMMSCTAVYIRTLRIFPRRGGESSQVFWEAKNKKCLRLQKQEIEM